MNLVVFTPPLLALVAGIAILIVPRLLNYVVAAYLILIGLIGLFPHTRLELSRWKWIPVHRPEMRHNKVWGSSVFP